MKKINFIVFLLLSSLAHNLLAMDEIEDFDNNDHSNPPSGRIKPISLGESPIALNGLRSISLSPMEVPNYLSDAMEELTLPPIQTQTVVLPFYYENSQAGLDLAFRHFCETLNSIHEYVNTDFIDKHLFLKSSLTKLANIIRQNKDDNQKVTLLHMVYTYIEQHQIRVNKNSILLLFPERIRDLWNSSYSKLILTPQEKINLGILDHFLEIANSYFNILTITPQLAALCESAVKTSLVYSLDNVKETFPSLIAATRNLFEQLPQRDALWVIAKFMSICPNKTDCPGIDKHVVSLVLEIDLKDVNEFLDKYYQSNH